MTPPHFVTRKPKNCSHAVALCRAGRPLAPHDGSDATLVQSRLVGKLPDVQAVVAA
jgi:hypothetical protein